MRIIYFIHRISISGGVKVLFQHVDLLNSRGFDAEILTLKNDFPAKFRGKVRVIEKLDSSFFEAELCVATKPADVLALFSSGINKKMPICHLIQGDEIAELEARVLNQLNFQTYGVRVLGNLFKVFKYFRRKKRFEMAYQLPTLKLGVSRHLCQMVQKRFNQKCFEISNGIDLSVFRPSSSPITRNGELWRIVSVGPLRVKTKGIEYILEAVRMLKDEGYPLHLSRIAGSPMSEREKKSGIVDSYYEGISETEVAQIIRSSDIMVLGSLEEEGFGLPCLEAMASKVPCVLTEIPAFTSLNKKNNFSCFVPPRDPQCIATGIRKLIENREYYNLIVNEGFQVVQKFSLEKVGDKLSEFYSNTLSDRF